MQYFEIGERLQPNLANFNLDSLPKYGRDEFEKQVQTHESVHPLISNYGRAS